MYILVEVIFIAVGVFTLTVSILNLDWFFNNYKAQRLVRIIGRTGARIFYSIISVILIIIGIGLITGFFG